MIAASLLVGLVGLAPEMRGGSGALFSGDVRVDVRNSAGFAQMGAAVFLYNRYDELIGQALTNERGTFVFAGLAADTYWIRVNLASFVPVVQRNIAVAPGSERLLKVNLSTLYSNAELAPPSAAPGALMSDEWKWVLRTSNATRPVLRLTPVSSSGSPSAGHRHLATTFTETTGVVRFSAGESGPLTGGGSEDVGTAFAVATRVNGDSRVRLSGDFGYIASSGLPTAAFRMTYSRVTDDGDTAPEIALTVHQVSFPGFGPASTPGTGYPASGGEEGLELRTVSFSAADKLQVNDDLQLEYGAQVDSVSFLQRETRVSPFARATYDMGIVGLLRLAYSAGAPPSGILNRDGGSREGEAGVPELNQDLVALSMLPAISLDNGQTRMQRARNMEAGYQAVQGSRKYFLAIYSETVSDAVFNMSGSGIFASRADLLPALDGNYYVFDIGNYQRAGLSAAVTQTLGEHSEFTLGAGRAGMLTANPGLGQGSVAPGETAAEVRGQIRGAQQAFITARASTTIPRLGTRIVAGYGWTGARALMPTHLSLTGSVNQEQGLNVAVHQPLPRCFAFHGRMEALVELRNALAEGYLPVNAGGYHTVLTDSPRALRGGLSFLF
jgi:Carboxypeptidase regulatory-like domain